MEFHKVPVSLFLQSVQVPLDGNPPLGYVDWFPQFDVIRKPNAINFYSKVFTKALALTSHKQEICCMLAEQLQLHKSAISLE